MAVGKQIWDWFRGEHDKNEPKPVIIDETDPRWIPRVEGSSQQRVQAGEVGQFNGESWHKIKYPP